MESKSSGQESPVLVQFEKLLIHAAASARRLRVSPGIGNRLNGFRLYVEDRGTVSEQSENLAD
jgi:hypothetical protein